MKYRFIIGSSLFSESRTDILQVACAAAPGSKIDFSPWPEDTVYRGGPEAGNPLTSFEYEASDDDAATNKGRAEAWIRNITANDNWSNIFRWNGTSWEEVT